MSRLLIVLLLLLPLLEIAGLVAIGSRIGVLATLTWVVGAAMAGGLLLQHGGPRVLRDIAAAAERGDAPVVEMIEAACLVVGAILLLIPGFVSDAVAVPLLLPFLRRPLAGLLIRSGRWRMAARGPQGTQPGGTTRRATVIDGEWSVTAPEEPAASEDPNAPGAANAPKIGDSRWGRPPGDGAQ